MSILSRAISPFVQALWRLVRSLFGRHHAGDLEAGTLAPVEAKIEVKQSEATKERIPTFQPDISGVPALVLSSMAVGAAFAPDTPIAVKTAHFPSAPAIPIIIVTPPATDDGAKQEHDDELGQSISKPVDAGRLPLRSMTNTPRVHGKPPRKTRSEEKENIRLHPSAPRLCHRRVEPVTSSLSATARTRKVVIVASPEWERAKVSRLKEAKEWSEAVKARRRSLPNSPAPSQSAVAKPALHRASLPARLPVSERLRLAVAGCASPTAPAVVIPPLWGEENVSFVLGDDEDEYAVGAISLPRHRPPVPVVDVAHLFDVDVLVVLWLDIFHNRGLRNRLHFICMARTSSVRRDGGKQS
ncbi:hypothetical protein MSAN_00821300 [Mycena sanguinolenta]|uniref:Uncharacterized protein n=1 Tax=Mycena sanguinolenta TaxID=230812 RepID=A0A8H6Z0E3_9AGAR|nr:hypothetical protein MSAN_00821300 [Mycena sanguinolenta]